MAAFVILFFLFFFVKKSVQVFSGNHGSGGSVALSSETKNRQIEVILTLLPQSDAIASTGSLVLVSCI